VGLDDAGAGGRGRRTDCRPCQDTPSALTLAFIPPSLATSVRMDSSVVMRATLPLTVALLLGAIVATTDPAAVVAIFRELGAPPRLSRLLEGESLLNVVA